MFRKLIDNRFTNPARPIIDRFCARHEILCRQYERLSNSPNPRIRDALFNQSAASLNHPAARCALSSWQVNDGVAKFSMPMRSSRIGFDWNHALGALGHDVEIKSIYRRVFKWSSKHSRKYLFLDCGANFGLHTAYHLSAGVPTHSYEPNPGCGEYFSILAEMNSWSRDHWHAVALGAEPGQAELVFPEGEEWLGSISKTVQFQDPQKLKRLSVAVLPLDQSTLPQLPTLMKIDVEGSEINVLRGATNLLRAQVEVVAFESWRESPDRQKLFDLFDSLGFDIARLNAEGQTQILSEGEFLALPLPNALALRRSQESDTMAASLR